MLYISHLVFADDNFIFSGANPDHLCYFCALFLCFETISGLKINLVKSELVLVGNVNNVDGLASIQVVGCLLYL
jgi:hypothetical protein